MPLRTLVLLVIVGAAIPAAAQDGSAFTRSIAPAATMARCAPRQSKSSARCPRSGSSRR